MEDDREEAIHVDKDNIMNKLVSLMTIIRPSRASILDTSEMIHALTSVSEEPIKLDGEVCQILSKDIEKARDNNDQIDSILRQFLNFAADVRAPGAAAAASTRIKGETAKLAEATPILDPFTKLEWMARICQENSIAVNNLSMVLESGQQIWNLFPAAIYSSFDCLIQILILWILFGAYIDVQALASGKSNAVLVHDNPQVTHATMEITALLEMRQKVMGSDLESKAPVPVTEILSDIILPVMKATKERLR